MSVENLIPLLILALLAGLGTAWYLEYGSAYALGGAVFAGLASLILTGAQR